MTPSRKRDHGMRRAKWYRSRNQGRSRPSARTSSARSRAISLTCACAPSGGVGRNFSADDLPRGRPIIVAFTCPALLSGRHYIQIEDTTRELIVDPVADRHTGLDQRAVRMAEADNRRPQLMSVQLEER